MHLSAVTKVNGIHFCRSLYKKRKGVVEMDKKRIDREIRGKISVFWKHLLMMVSILAMAVGTLIVSNSLSLKNLTDANLKQMQLNLEHNSENLSDRLYAASLIPESVERSRYFFYLRGERADSLPDKYAAVIQYLAEILRNQGGVLGVYEESMLYLFNTNSVCGTWRNFYTLEECLETYLDFEQTSPETVAELLRTKNTMSLLPAQEITRGEGFPETCVTLIVAPRGTATALLVIYSQEEILRQLGMESMPEGSCIRLTGSEGEVLLEYPKVISEEMIADSYRLEAEMPEIKAHVESWIPKDYFSRIVSPSHKTGLAMLTGIMLVGILLAVLFSRISVNPLRNLLMNYGHTERKNMGNEIYLLDQMIHAHSDDFRTVQHYLLTNLLVQAFSGRVLSEDEEELLTTRLAVFAGTYQVAVVKIDKDKGQVLWPEWMDALLPKEFYKVLINKREWGIFFPGNGNCVQQLQEGIEKLNLLLKKEFCAASCGVSAPVQGLEKLYISIRQCRIAIPEHPGLVVYDGQPEKWSGIAWLEHEQLRQHILSGNLERACELLGNIARGTENNEMPERFYHLCFLLRCAAEELKLSLPAEMLPVLNHQLTCEENILRLTEPLAWLSDRLKLIRESREKAFKEELLGWIQGNIENANMCAIFVADHFQITENQVYEIVRQETGQSFSSWILMLRMNRAAKLLCSDEMTVGGIAAQCGYQAESTFYRVFKKYHGITPNQYRGRSVR